MKINLDALDVQQKYNGLRRFLGSPKSSLTFVSYSAQNMSDTLLGSASCLEISITNNITPVRMLWYSFLTDWFHLKPVGRQYSYYQVMRI